MIGTTLRDRTSTSSSSQVLVDGTYSGTVARDFVQALIEASLTVHKLQNLSAQVNSQEPNADATRAVADLESARLELGELLRKAKGDGLRVRLHSTIEIEVEDASLNR